MPLQRRTPAPSAADYPAMSGQNFMGVMQDIHNQSMQNMNRSMDNMQRRKNSILRQKMEEEREKAIGDAMYELSVAEDKMLMEPDPEKQEKLKESLGAPMKRLFELDAGRGQQWLQQHDVKKRMYSELGPKTMEKHQKSLAQLSIMLLDGVEDRDNPSPRDLATFQQNAKRFVPQYISDLPKIVGDNPWAQKIAKETVNSLTELTSPMAGEEIVRNGFNQAVYGVKMDPGVEKEWRAAQADKQREALRSKKSASEDVRLGFAADKNKREEERMGFAREDQQMQRERHNKEMNAPDTKIPRVTEREYRHSTEELESLKSDEEGIRIPFTNKRILSGLTEEQKERKGTAESVKNRYKEQFSGGQRAPQPSAQAASTPQAQQPQKPRRFIDDETGDIYEEQPDGTKKIIKKGTR